MDTFAGYVQSLYKNADNNRRDLQLKWEQNRKWFSGNLYPDGDRPAKDEKWKSGEAEGWRSETFPGTTHSKVISAFVIAMDTVLSGGQIPFMLKPYSENRQRAQRGQGLGDPKIIEQASDQMTDLIQQQFGECKADRHMAKNLFSMSLYGETYAKLAVKQITRSGWEQQQPQVSGMDLSRVQTPGQWTPWKETILAPHWFYITLWDIFRDWETDDMDECGFIIHRQITDNFWIRTRKGKPFFRDTVIDAAIALNKTDSTKSNPSVGNNEDVSNMAPYLRQYLTTRTRNRQNLEFWGRVPKEIVEQYESELAENKLPPTNSLTDDQGNGDEIECHGMVIDGQETIRFVKTDPKMRPFAYARWEDNCDEWTSRGVADNCHEMSSTIRGAFRLIEDGAKLTSNPMSAVKRRLVKNMPKELVPGLQIDVSDDCDDARKAIQPVVIPDVSGSVKNLFEIAVAQNEQDSMVPAIAQGQLEKQDQTAREASIRQSQSLKYIGMAIRNSDTGLVEPMVQKFYDYNMNDQAIAEGKGNYLVQALGFNSFQNKTERLRIMTMLLDRLLASPVLAKKYKVEEVFEEMIKALDIDPDQLKKSDEEMQQESQDEAMAKQLAVQADGAKIEKDKAVAVKDRAAAVKSLADAHSKTMEAPMPPSEPTPTEPAAPAMTQQGVAQ